MRSFTKIVTIAAMAAFAVMAAAQSERTYSQNSARVIAAESFKASNPLAEVVYGNGLEKRQSGSCPTGSSACPNGRTCCATGTVCATTGCCGQATPYACGTNNCCEHNTPCLPNGDCGCAPGTSACGSYCCKYGCEGTKCACAPGYGTRCTGKEMDSPFTHS
ncbi:hypothetical protein BGZ81_007746 [Podila clonocystis]|nr:hypothetical protein BGZ81_007746 [Podila clonocystis]